MNRLDFTQAVVRIRVLEKRLLSFETLERMIDAENTAEMIRRLNETDYARHVALMTKDLDFEQILSKELQNVYQLVHEISPNSAIVELLSLKYDFHNLKVLMKEICFKTELTNLYIPIGSLQFEKLKIAFDNNELKNINPYMRSMITEVMDDFQMYNDSQRIELLLDEKYVNMLYLQATETNIPLFLEYVQAMIDFINVRTMIRMQRLEKNVQFPFFEKVLFPHGNISKKKLFHLIHLPLTDLVKELQNEKNGKSLVKAIESYRVSTIFADYEKVMDDSLMDLALSAKYVNFGPEPLFTYILAKETEIKNLRVIFIAKTNKLSQSVIRKRVRDMYV